MVGIVASFRCKCGIRVKVLAEADPSQPPATQTVACPRCGESESIQADKIVSVTENTSSDISPAVFCEEKANLLVARNRAFDIYRRASAELSEAVGKIAHAEFEFLASKVSNARQSFLETADQLTEHTAKHGC
jgi:hypothetical protein